MIPALVGLLVLGCSEPTYYPRPLHVGDGPDTGVVDTGPDDTGDALPCSVQGGAPVTLTVRNETAEAGTMWWRAFDCEELPYSPVISGSEITQETFAGHVWVLRNAVGELLGMVELGDDPEQTWVVQ